MRRALLAAALLLVAALAVYASVLRERRIEPDVVLPKATSTIGSGAEAVAVDPAGRVLTWLPLPDAVALPQLPLAAPPPDGRLDGPAREQARVLGAAPAALRPYIGGSSYGEDGIDVELRSGIELRFGDASQLAAKWRTAATVLANPSITALDYVNLYAPSHPAVGGSGHELPPPP